MSSGDNLPWKNSLRSLYPFIHKDGILRVGGRLKNSYLPFGAKHQFIIPSSHHLSDLIIRDAHMKTMDGGAQFTMSMLRENFWIPSLKQKVKGLINSCITCFHQRAQFSQQLLGQLPVSRVQPSFVFVNVGVDFAGPITIKYDNPRSKVPTKAYFAIFICLVTRVVHVEIVSSLSSQSFMSTFN